MDGKTYEVNYEGSKVINTKVKEEKPEKPNKPNKPEEPIHRGVAVLFL